MSQQIKLLLVMGIGIGAYLAAAHWLSLGVVCPGQQQFHWINCNFIINSPGSILFRLPLGIWGSVWCLGAYVVLKTPGRIVWILLGVGGVAWAMGHEISWGSWCVWCTVLQLVILISSVLTWSQEFSRPQWRHPHA